MTVSLQRFKKNYLIKSCLKLLRSDFFLPVQFVCYFCTIRFCDYNTLQKVLETFQASSEPLNAGKVAELSGLDRKEVDKAMAKLKAEGKIESPKRCYWQAVK